jgi:recombination associated protein RdgC
MWFKNLQVYRFTRPFELTAEQLESQLETLAFTPCGSQDMSRFGWTRPLGKFGSTLTHSADGQILICARKEEKIIPPAVIKEELAEKIEAVECEQGRDVYRAQCPYVGISISMKDVK